MFKILSVLVILSAVFGLLVNVSAIDYKIAADVGGLTQQADLQKNVLEDLKIKTQTIKDVGGYYSVTVPIIWSLGGNYAPYKFKGYKSIMSVSTPDGGVCYGAFQDFNNCNASADLIVGVYDNTGKSLVNNYAPYKSGNIVIDGRQVKYVISHDPKPLTYDTISIELYDKKTKLNYNFIFTYDTNQYSSAQAMKLYKDLMGGIKIY